MASTARPPKSQEMQGARIEPSPSALVGWLVGWSAGCIARAFFFFGDDKKWRAGSADADWRGLAWIGVV
ncbi:hypothetical protein SAMD00023353_9600230 [Rosellinia necatrix]|uniref:Uncharacterized protein n=1 Tax=Rosellinia necatrix TaxID=77044 RepID=A0A1S8AB13_ROSNE|nr:hypothetical protein SAMD00023353_9600230 [Rosellinia necatrix]